MVVPHVLLALIDDYGVRRHTLTTSPTVPSWPQPYFLDPGSLWQWANAGWHRNYTAPVGGAAGSEPAPHHCNTLAERGCESHSCQGGSFVPATDEVSTPHMDALVRDGIELDRAYAYKYCSPSRSALQTGRDPYHVNVLNAEPSIVNRSDPEAGFAGVPRSMTGIASKLAAAGYATAMFGKWDAGGAIMDQTPRGRGYQQVSRGVAGWVKGWRL